MALARPSFESLMSLVELAEKTETEGHTLQADLLKGHLALEFGNYIFSESNPLYRYQFVYQFYAINHQIMSLILNGQHEEKRQLLEWHYDSLIKTAHQIHAFNYQPSYLPDAEEIVRFSMFSPLQIQMCNAILAEEDGPLSEEEVAPPAPPQPVTPPPRFEEKDKQEEYRNTPRQAYF